jgi:hypothetical protein
MKIYAVKWILVCFRIRLRLTIRLLQSVLPFVLLFIWFTRRKGQSPKLITFAQPISGSPSPAASRSSSSALASASDMMRGARPRLKSYSLSSVDCPALVRIKASLVFSPLLTTYVHLQKMRIWWYEMFILWNDAKSNVSKAQQYAPNWWQQSAAELSAPPPMYQEGPPWSNPPEIGLSAIALCTAGLVLKVHLVDLVWFLCRFGMFLVHQDSPFKITITCRPCDPKDIWRMHWTPSILNIWLT